MCSHNVMGYKYNRMLSESCTSVLTIAPHSPPLAPQGRVLSFLLSSLCPSGPLELCSSSWFSRGKEGAPECSWASGLTVSPCPLQGPPRAPFSRGRLPLRSISLCFSVLHSWSKPHSVLSSSGKRASSFVLLSSDFRWSKWHLVAQSSSWASWQVPCLFPRRRENPSPSSFQPVDFLQAFPENYLNYLAGCRNSPILGLVTE